MLIDFKMNPEEMRPSPGKSPDPFLRAPVRIKIADLEFTNWNENWQPLPSEAAGLRVSVPALARFGLIAIKRMPILKKGGYRYDGSESGLIFRMNGENIVIANTVTNKARQVCYSSLEEIWENFSDRVRQCIKLEFSEFLGDLKHDPSTIQEYVSLMHWDEWIEGPIQESPGLIRMLERESKRSYALFVKISDVLSHPNALEECET